MTAQEAYDQYDIMPNLQLHQLRVAGVTSQIVDSFKESLDRDSIITACLLHDMGSIIIFDLTKFPQYLEPQGILYWQNIKEKFEQKYGKEEHLATYQIADEIGISIRTKEILESIGFSRSPIVFESDDLAKKISCYADQRVSPHGITSLEERINEGLARGKGVASSIKTKIGFEKLLMIEDQIFANSQISQDDITDESIDPLIQPLRSFVLI